MRSEFFGDSATDLPGDFGLQNPTVLRVRLNGDLLARVGTMIAHQGRVDLIPEGPALPAEESLGNVLRRRLSGAQQLPRGQLVRCRGQGLVFLAAGGRRVHLFHLEDEGLTVNGDALLAFAPTLTAELQPTQDDYITVVRGTGTVAITTHGIPVLLDTGRAPTVVAAPAAVCWSPDLRIGVHPSSEDGHSLRLALQGQGFVLVEAGEPHRG